MKRFIVILFSLVVLGLAFVLLSVPVLWGRGVSDTAERIWFLKSIELSGKTLFVSDFHLTNPAARANLDTTGVGQIIIVGDFFHSPRYFAGFGDTTKERIENGLAVFLPPDFTGNVYFISAFTHDPQFEPFEFEYKGIRFFHVGKLAKFNIDGLKVVSLHGEELYQGIVGGGVSWLFQKFGAPLPLERLGKTKFGIAKDTWFITGHSHVPAIDQESKTANTGSFVGAPLNNLIFHLAIGTGILVENGKAELVDFDTPVSSDIFWF